MHAQCHDREGLLQNGNQEKKKQELLLGTGKLYFTFYVYLDCVGGYCAYYRVVRARRMYAPKSKCALNS